MSWIKKDLEVVVNNEMEYSLNITKTDAYEIEITECYIKPSADANSKSVSLAVSGKTESGENVRTFFTIQGKDGNTFYRNDSGAKVQHFGLSKANTMFKIALGREIFDCEPRAVEYSTYNKTEKKKEIVSGDGFPELVGMKIGVAVQMIRELKGVDSTEYATIEHFFDCNTGLFADEKEGKNTKLSLWLKSAKDFKTIDNTPKQTNTQAWGGAKQQTSEVAQPLTVNKGWGSRG